MLTSDSSRYQGAAGYQRLSLTNDECICYLKTDSPETIAEITCHAVTQNTSVHAQPRDDIARAPIGEFRLLLERS